jgi:hypothetical protein
LKPGKAGGVTKRHRRMAGDGELNAHKRQPGDIPVVDKLLATVIGKFDGTEISRLLFFVSKNSRKLGNSLEKKRS